MVTITPEQPAFVAYVAVAGQASFEAGCRAFEGYLDSFVVTVNDAPCTYAAVPVGNRQFSVTENGEAPATISFGAGLLAGDVVAIRRQLPLARQLNLPEAGPISIAELNDELSRLVGLIQDSLGRIDGEIFAPLFSTTIAATPRAAPYNVLRNSQWEIWSAVGTGARWKADGTGLLPTANLVSNTTAGPTVNLTLDAVPASWQVGHIVKVSGYTGGLYLADRPLPIVAILDATRIQVQMPLNLIPTATGTGTVTNVSVGGPASVGTGDAADYWKKTVAAQVWRDDDPANRKHGSQYALGLCQSAASDVLYVELDVTRFRGRQVVFGGWVKKCFAGGAGTHHLYVNSDGAGGGVHYSAFGAVASIGSYEYLEVTATFPDDMTWAQVGVEFLGGAGHTYHFINPMLSFGSYLGPNGYTKPREELIPIVKLEPQSWINAAFIFPASAGASSVSFGYGFSFDLFAASGGQVARSVRLVEGSIEGINTNAVATGIGGSRLIGWTDGNVDPIRLGNFMSQQVQNVKCHQPLRIPLVDGRGHVFSGIASDSWGNVSVDLDVFHLE